jgi:hypothetical protein
MTSYSSPKLRDYGWPIVRFQCDVCGRAGRYRKETLIEKYGGEIVLPDLRGKIAGCPNANKVGGRCGVYYPDLASKSA